MKKMVKAKKFEKETHTTELLDLVIKVHTYICNSISYYERTEKTTTRMKVLTAERALANELLGERRGDNIFGSTIVPMLEMLIESMQTKIDAVGGNSGSKKDK